jgi:peptidoglycan/LPS O-acetylase OafA/YrhL
VRTKKKAIFRIAVAATLPTPSLIALHDAVTSADRASRLGQRYEYDLLRAAAAISVFLCHFFGLVGELPREWAEWSNLSGFFQRIGSLGTNALLFLAGFFVARSLSGPEFHYRFYVKRRLAVMGGPYACVIVCATIVSLLAPGLSKFEEDVNPVSYLLRQFLVIPGLFPEAPLLTVAWILPIVISSYLLAPLWHWPVREANVWKRAAYWSSTLVGAVLVFSLLNWDLRGLSVLAGLAGYFLARAIESKVTGATVPLALLLLGLACGVYIALGTAWNWDLPYLGLLTLAMFLVTASVVSTSATKIPGALLPAQSFGQAGYSFYLLHGSVTKVMLVILFPGFGYNLSAPSDLVLALLLCLGAAIVGSQVLYRCVEKPIRENVDANGERRLSEAERQQVIESLQPRGPVRYSRADAEYR